MSDDHTTTKRRLEQEVAKAQDRATKARKLATEMDAMAMATEGDLYVAKRALQAHDGGGGDAAPLDTLEMSAEEEAMMAAVEQQQQPSEGTGTRNGYPLIADRDNIAFEALLQNGTLDLKRRGDKQVIMHGRNGRRSDIFDNKDLFKRTDPRFFFDMDDKAWQRPAPASWQP